MDCSGRTRDVGSGGLAELARIKPRAKAMKIRSLISSDLNRDSYREHIIDDILPFGFFEMNLNGHVLGVYPDDDWSQKQIDELGISEPISVWFEFLLESIKLLLVEGKHGQEVIFPLPENPDDFLTIKMSKGQFIIQLITTFPIVSTFDENDC